jgi:hypothetical protein
MHVPISIKKLLLTLLHTIVLMVFFLIQEVVMLNTHGRI